MNARNETASSDPGSTAQKSNEEVSRIRSAVTISLVPQAKNGPFVFSGDLEKSCARAAELGFDGVEIFTSPDHRFDPIELSKILNKHQLRLAAVGTGGGFLVKQWHLSHPDSAVREKAERFVREIIELAGPFGAPAILGSMQGRFDAPVSRDQALEWLGKSLQSLAVTAEAHGVPLLFEALNRYESNLFNRLEDVGNYIRSLNVKNLRLLADLFHMNIEEADHSQALESVADILGHVHWADSNRRAAGFGHTHFGPVAGALRKIGFNGFLSAEVLPWPDPDAAAAQTVKSLNQYFTL
jgi:sugar phosphate isomerase/epimerase